MSEPIPIKFQLYAEVTKISDLAPENPGHFRLDLRAPEIAEKSRPGQFVHVLPPSGELMLRRPLSLMAVKKKEGVISVLFRVIGEGTRAISQVKAGDRLDVIGPLGNGFPADMDAPSILAGGGVGILPLVYLAQKLKGGGKSGKGKKREDVHVFLGARDSGTLVCVDEFRSMGIEPVVATEDGSIGVKGLITEALSGAFSEIPSDTVVYSCGPVPMLDAVAHWSEKNKLECYVSMENKLGCGIGACLGCSVPVLSDDEKTKYERVCCDGPVFNAKRVLFKKINH